MSELSRICQLGSEIVRCSLLAQHPTPTGSWPCPHQGCLPFPPELLPVPRSSLYFKEEWKTRVICPTWLPAAEIPCGLLCSSHAPPPLGQTQVSLATHQQALPPLLSLLQHARICLAAALLLICHRKQMEAADKWSGEPQYPAGHNAPALCPWSGWCPTSRQPLHPDQDMLCPSSCQGNLCPEPSWPWPEMRT